MITAETLKLLEEVRPLLRDWIIQRTIEEALGELPKEPVRPFTLRISERLRQRIEDQATANGNSINTEITRILIESYRQENAMNDIDLTERVRVLEAALDKLVEVVRDIVSDGEGHVNPGFMALARKALTEAEEVQANGP